MVLALAASLCAVIIVATLLLSSTKIHNIAPSITSKDGSRLRIQLLIGVNTTTTTQDITLNKIKIRRHLSSDLLNCPKLNRPKPQLPSVPNLLLASTYAASFPGLGADKLITKHLVESITGMLVGEASISPSLERMKAQHMDSTGFARGQGEVVVVRTHFPHTSGRLAAYDDRVPRAFVVLRNPLHAIPCYFDQLYQMHSHIPVGSSSSSSKETQDAWIKWRDNQFSDQLLLYRNFVSFWMLKYLGKDDERIYFAYEDLMDEEMGAHEAIRLAGFLEGGIKASAMEIMTQSSQLGPDSIAEEAVKSFADISEVPCVWKDIVTSTTQQIPEEANQSSFREPTERPFTAENLAEMSTMLLDLINRWSRHQRVLSILSGYRREVLNIGDIQRPLDN